MTAVLSKTSVAHRRSGAQLTLFESVGQEFTDHFTEFGFVLLADALTPDEVAAVNADALKLCRGDYGTIRYGLSDADRPDETAADLASAGSDDEILRRYLCIHFPHKVSAAARRALASPRIVQGLTAPITAVQQHAVDDEIERLRSMLGDSRFTVRFPAPIQAELISA